MKSIRYYLDPETSDLHIHSHDVSAEEVESVLRSPLEVRAGREGAKVALGKTPNGRYLKVIYAHDAARDSVFVITAFDLRLKALRALLRRRKKRP